MVRILQANLQRKAVAHDVAFAVARENAFDLIVASEPNLNRLKNQRWMTDRRQDIAMYVMNRKIGISGVSKGQGHLSAKLGTFWVTGCYASPNMDLTGYEDFVTGVLNSVEGNKQRIILGDFNAKSGLWGSPVQDNRGQIWEEVLGAKDMVVLNDGLVPTWRRGTSKSYIDVTCATKKIARKVKGWRVMEDESLSDHAFITFEVEEMGRKRTEERMEGKTIIDQVRLRLEIEDQFRSMRDLPNEEEMIKGLCKAQDKATVRRAGQVLKAPYWWNAEIERERRRCIGMRRHMLRERRRNAQEPGTQVNIAEYKEARKVLTKMIKASKRRHWKEVCEDLNNDIWGRGYQIVVKDLKRPDTPYELTQQKKCEIARCLFPTVDEQAQDEAVQVVREVEAFVPVTAREVREAAGKLKRKRSPGRDGLLTETVQCAVEIGEQKFVDLFNELLKEGRFPTVWKQARLILIWKGKDPIDAPGSQRPICLLDTMGKLFEGIIRDRLVEDIEGGEGFSANQYGFRKGKSTIQAVERVQRFVDDSRRHRLCALVTVDIKNAFNTASWRRIIGELSRRGTESYLLTILKDYLKDRAIYIGRERMNVTTGVPQGSVLGPTLWNVLYDGVLRMGMPPDVQTVAFADDLALIVRGNDPEDIITKGNRALARISEWMEASQLQIAPHKTEAILLKGHRRTVEIRFRVGETDIIPSREVKYLGINMDIQNTYGPHVQKVCDKAMQRIATLTRLMPNIGGMATWRRQIYSGVIHSIILYGAPVWRRVVRIGRHKQRLISTQRKALLRVATAYRTVSAKALQVICGVPPIDLLVEERARIHDREDSSTAVARKEEREATLREWQERWDREENVAGWTRQLIPRISEWYGCGHRRLNYYFSQFLTGHGAFKTYTKRLGKVQDEGCMYCGERDSAEHTVMRCPRWERERMRVGWWTPDLDGTILVGEMLRDKGRWIEAEAAITKIMEEKEKEERRSQGRQ